MPSDPSLDIDSLLSDFADGLDLDPTAMPYQTVSSTPPGLDRPSPAPTPTIEVPLAKPSREVDEALRSTSRSSEEVSCIQYPTLLGAPVPPEPDLDLASRVEPPKPQVGRKFGRYRIRRALGEGAMGMVYLAEDSLLEREVALKLPIIADDDPETLERFLVEARIAATLRHPNICPVYDVGDVEGQHYITMAFIPGRPLSHYAQSDRRPAVRQVVKVIRKLAFALHAAHVAGIVHRDVKPANIMVDENREPVLMDFGLARRTDPTTVRLTRAGAIIGTPAYMSPEQVEGRIDDVGPASDQFSLGSVLFELLTGQLPFAGSSVTSVMSKILRSSPPPIRSLRPDVDEELERITLRMLAKSDRDRFDSLADVAEETSHWLRRTKAAKSQRDRSSSRNAERRRAELKEDGSSVIRLEAYDPPPREPAKTALAPPRSSPTTAPEREPARTSHPTPPPPHTPSPPRHARGVQPSPSGTIAAYVFVGLVPIQTPEALWFIFTSGVIAISAMVLPGLSGSYLLLLLGQYVPILNAVDQFKEALRNRDLAAAMAPALEVVLPVGLGVIAGVVLVGNLLRWLMDRYHQATMGVLLGLLLGSVVGLYPFQRGVEPQPGDVINGREMTTAMIEELEPEKWPTERYVPQAGEVFVSLALIGLGYSITWGVGRWGRQDDAPTGGD